MSVIRNISVAFSTAALTSAAVMAVPVAASATEQAPKTTMTISAAVGANQPAATAGAVWRIIVDGQLACYGDGGGWPDNNYWVTFGCARGIDSSRVWLEDGDSGRYYGLCNRQEAPNSGGYLERAIPCAG